MSPILVSKKEDDLFDEGKPVGAFQEDEVISSSTFKALKDPQIIVKRVHGPQIFMRKKTHRQAPPSIELPNFVKSIVKNRESSTNTLLDDIFNLHKKQEDSKSRTKVLTR